MSETLRPWWTGLQNFINYPLVELGSNHLTIGTVGRAKGCGEGVALIRWISVGGSQGVRRSWRAFAAAWSGRVGTAAGPLRVHNRGLTVRGRWRFNRDSG